MEKPDPVKTLKKIARLEKRANKLWAMRCFPDSFAYRFASCLWDEAQNLRKTLQG